MIEIDDTKLSELLCARLCHDLASPLGAAAAGLELLEDGTDAETVGLIAASMSVATARLKFLRTALGPATDMPHTPASLRELTRAYLAGNGQAGVSLAWTCSRGELSGDAARLLLNLILIARDALPRGGDITVQVAAAPDFPSQGLNVVARGDGAGLSAEARLVLVDGAPLAGPRGAQAWYTRLLAHKTKSDLKVDAGSQGILIMV
ncbi:MAG: hypothetical protein HY055_07850 [Magnetospirillum sp.]|nr:hypothetical protein [Magnetospirillum sp.]